MKQHVDAECCIMHEEVKRWVDADEERRGPESPRERLARQL
jgi:hypothetical protein